jgi:hypothetical protein
LAGSGWINSAPPEARKTAICSCAPSEIAPKAALSHPETESGSAKSNYQVAHIEARAGRTREARLLLESLEGLQGASGSQIYVRALAYAALKDTDHAFSALEDLYRSRNPELLGIAIDPAGDPLRGDARFTDLLRRIG